MKMWYFDENIYKLGIFANTSDLDTNSSDLH